MAVERRSDGRRADIMYHFQGTPWPSQVRVLEEVAHRIDNVDVVVIRSPVASGKSKVADCLVRWMVSTGRAQSGVIVANNRLLVRQYLDSVSGYSQLFAAEEYQCGLHGIPCRKRKQLTDRYCLENGNVYHPSSCPWVRDLRSARSSKRVVVNQHVYAAHKLYRDVVVFDEAHTLESLMAERAAKTLWRTDYGWRKPLFSSADVSEWLSSVTGRADDRLEALDDLLSGRSTKWTVTTGVESLRGRDTEFIRLLPLNVRDEAGVMWPSGRVAKLVLMSATFSDSDVAALGLDGRRVLVVEAESAIPVERRPIVFRPVAPMDFRRRAASLPIIARHIRDVVLPEYSDVRGLIHLPYSMHDAFHAEVGDCSGRLVYAGREGRAHTVAEWLSSESTDSVLVGSGLHEGLDLRDDLARFQVVVATPRKNIADPGLLHLAETDPDRYEWLTVRELGQLVGRVCRHPEDWGDTLILDSTAIRELGSAQLPEWARAAVVHDTHFSPDNRKGV